MMEIAQVDQVHPLAVAIPDPAAQLDGSLVADNCLVPVSILTQRTGLDPCQFRFAPQVAQLAYQSESVLE
jgi:hypothetical protein